MFILDWLQMSMGERCWYAAIMISLLMISIPSVLEEHRAFKRHDKYMSMLCGRKFK